MRIPLRLEADPIIEAVIEMRFESATSLSDVLPGVLLNSIEGGAVSIERLAAAEIPKPIRDQDPNLTFQPLVKMAYGEYSLLIGDKVLAVSCPIPYPGGKAFKKKAIEVFVKALSLPISIKLTRLSMKYVDFIEGESLEGLTPYLNLSISIAGETVSLVNPYGLRLEVADGDIVHLLQVAAPIDVSVNNAPQKKGGLMDVDSILKVEVPLDAIEFQLSELLDKLHLANKKKFFALLTDVALEKLGAIYE